MFCDTFHLSRVLQSPLIYIISLADPGSALRLSWQDLPRTQRTSRLCPNQRLPSVSTWYLNQSQTARGGGRNTKSVSHYYFCKILNSQVLSVAKEDAWKLSSKGGLWELWRVFQPEALSFLFFSLLLCIRQNLLVNYTRMSYFKLMQTWLKCSLVETFLFFFVPMAEKCI